MNEIIKYFKSNPCHLSSILLFSNLPYTAYSKNYLLLITQIPITVTSILYHHKFNIKNIREIDIIVGQFAYWQHMIHALMRSNYVSINSFLLCPILYILSKHFHKKNQIYETNLIHSFIHYFLSIGAMTINFRTIHNAISN